jgi:hypothetical protein
MLTPFDDFPIHASADPIAHPATGDPNHYDRYFFNGHERDGAFYIGGAMGHYPVRGVIDAAFSIVVDGVEHSVFASGLMPFDRKTEIGPLRVEVTEPMRTIRFVVEPNEHGISADLTFRARTVALEEPRQKMVRDGIQTMDHTRLTQWGTWEGTILLDGTEIVVDPTRVTGTRDRSWGMRPVGTPFETNRPQQMPRAFWLWAPLHFDDVCTHLALHEHENGERWLQSALIVPLLDGPDAPTYGVDPTTEMAQLHYDIEWKPGRRESQRTTLRLVEHSGEEHTIVLDTLYTFRMRGIGYSGHPKWGHGSSHGELETGRESIALDEFDPFTPSSMHIQNVVRATWGDRVGVGVLEQATFGPHTPTGLTGFLDPPA